MDNVRLFRSARYPSVVAALAAFIGTIAIGSSVTANAQRQVEPAGGIDAIDQLDCGPAEADGIIFFPPPVYPGDLPAPGTPSPEEALSRFLGERFNRVPERAFERIAEASARVQFGVRRNGELKATVLAEEGPGGWLADTAAVCSSLVS